MNVEDLLEELDEVLDKAWTVPGGKGLFVDVEKLREIVDDIRLNMPDEFKPEAAKYLAKIGRKLIDMIEEAK